MAGRAVARGAFDEPLHPDFDIEIFDPEPCGVSPGQQIDERAKILSGRFAQRHEARRQVRQLITPVRDHNIDGHSSRRHVRHPWHTCKASNRSAKLVY